jgi:hypothetical protein
MTNPIKIACFSKTGHCKTLRNHTLKDMCYTSEVCVDAIFPLWMVFMPKFFKTGHVGPIKLGVQN